MAGTSEKPEGPDLAKGVPAASLPDDGTLSGHVGEEPVLLARLGGEIVAIGARCTHYGGPLGKGIVSGDRVHCPWHHACFSLRTGEADAPAFDPLPRWRVEVSGDRIVVREKLPKTEPVARPADGARFGIVGGGAAGFAAAHRLRREGFSGEIVILSADPDRPVDRPNLSKDFLAGKAPESWVFLKPASFFERQKIQLELGAEVTTLDAAARRVGLADGRSFSFDKLLLATGAEPVRLPIPGADKPHVFTLRSLGDSRAIVARMDGAKAAVVVGASFIGLEAAASLVARGLEVHVVAPDERPLEKVLGPEIGDFVQARHESKGVRFHLGRKPASIEDDGVTLDDGTRIAADLVVMGVGVRPRTGLAEAAGLRVENGVVVDAFLETSAPGVFAAGDIARFPYALPGGGTARIEHWVVAGRQGQLAAMNMLGAGRPYAQAPFFWSMHHGLAIRYVGHAAGWDSVEIDGSVAEGNAVVRYRKDRRVVAVATLRRDMESLQAEVALEREDA